MTFNYISLLDLLPTTLPLNTIDSNSLQTVSMESSSEHGSPALSIATSVEQTPCAATPLNPKKRKAPANNEDDTPEAAAHKIVKAPKRTRARVRHQTSTTAIVTDDFADRRWHKEGSRNWPQLRGV